jgi:predicted AAA+ superfamily ATPase
VNGEASAKGTSVTPRTVGNYLEAISKVMILDRLPAWNTHLRSKATLRISAKYFLADPSLAVAALKATPESLFADLELLGQLFENLVMRDLLVYAQHIGATVSYYRDSNDLEVDAIVDHADGSWQALEIKLGQAGIDQGADSLKRLTSAVDTKKRGEPKALTVVTSVGPTYTREDGVHVVALQHLGV